MKFVKNEGINYPEINYQEPINGNEGGKGPKPNNFN